MKEMTLINIVNYLTNKEHLSKKEICYILNMSHQTLHNVQTGKLQDIKLSNFVRMYKMLNALGKKETAEYILNEVMNYFKINEEIKNEHEL
jgi:DNA-binding Xre family transcriptional regulator